MGRYEEIDFVIGEFHRVYFIHHTDNIVLKVGEHSEHNEPCLRWT